MEQGAAEQFFDGIYGFFEALVELGETWGGPWPLLVPVGVAALIALVLLRGIKSVVSGFESGAFGYVVAVILIGVLVVAAALNSDRDGGSEDGDGGPVPETVVTGS